MPQKNFSLYSPAFETELANNSLVIELSNSHMACMVKTGEQQKISAFELFKFSKDESLQFEKLFMAVNMGSKLLNKVYKESTLYVNTEFAQLIPMAKFNKETAKDFLEIIHGEDKDAHLFFDHLPAELEMVNAFRVPAEWLEVIQGHLITVTVKHVYSSIIPPFLLLHANSKSVLKLQFYYQHFIAAVSINGKLQIIQSYFYITQEDVLYHLLNTLQSLEIAIDEASVELSGMIDLNSSLYSEIKKYFSEIVVEKPGEENFLFETNGEPFHYFTPFINLTA